MTKFLIEIVLFIQAIKNGEYGLILKIRDSSLSKYKLPFETLTDEQPQVLVENLIKEICGIEAKWIFIKQEGMYNIGEVLNYDYYDNVLKIIYSCNIHLDFLELNKDYMFVPLKQINGSQCLNNEDRKVLNYVFNI